MNNYQFAKIQNGKLLPINSIPKLKINEFRNSIISNTHNGKRLLCLCADRSLNMFAVLSDDEKKTLWINCTQLYSNQYQSLTPECIQAHMFEREMAEQLNIYPQNHPYLKPVRFNNNLQKNNSFTNETLSLESLGPGLMDFYTIKGKEIHEVAVGPVHAGIIESGHFRFQCHGEMVLFLELALGYQHRGIENRMLGKHNFLHLKYAETIAGDSTIAHTWAYCQILEGLANNMVINPNILLIRSIALELERIANHIGDLGNIAGDIGFLPTSESCGYIRGAWLNLTAEFCGSRMGRNWLCPGGLQITNTKEEFSKILDSILKIWNSTESAISLMLNTTSVLNRLEGIGKISTIQAKDIGLVGIPARACGLKIDTRKTHSSNIYNKIPIEISNHSGGDVYSRTIMRWFEIKESYKFLCSALKKIIQTDEITNRPSINVNHLISNSICVSIIEGWRGEVLHFATTDSSSNFTMYKIVDPSFHNWFGLTLSLRNELISDFPLCNKSFNLSYCGHDL